jgi:hypothetical protein
LNQDNAPLLETARADLKRATGALSVAFESVHHDLWEGNALNVAPTRIEKTRELRSKGVQHFTDRDLDYVMFKTMTTMGGEASFKFFLPRFLNSVLAYPSNLGWASGSHVLLSKCKKIEFESWTALERGSIFDALEAFAVFEWAIEAHVSGNSAITDLGYGVHELIDFAQHQRQHFSFKELI